MAKFRVIKAHDGIEAGTIKVLAPSRLTAKMVQNGWWEEVVDDQPKPEKPKPQSKKKK
jgi:hypothetical protein